MGGGSTLSRRTFLFGASSLVAARPGGPQRRSLGPGVRNGHVLVHDPVRGVLVLVGGADAQAVRAETWIRKGEVWRPAGPGGPGPRTFPAAAFDRRRGRLVLFGGNRVLFGPEGARDTLRDDTWEWNGAAWKRLLVSGPLARSESSACFDERPGRVVLFGGWRWVRDGVSGSVTPGSSTAPAGSRSARTAPRGAAGWRWRSTEVSVRPSSSAAAPDGVRSQTPGNGVDPAGKDGFRVPDRASIRRSRRMRLEASWSASGAGTDLAGSEIPRFAAPAAGSGRAWRRGRHHGTTRR